MQFLICKQIDINPSTKEFEARYEIFSKRIFRRELFQFAGDREVRLVLLGGGNTSEGGSIGYGVMITVPHLKAFLIYNSYKKALPKAQQVADAFGVKLIVNGQIKDTQTVLS
jgi:hypothetical protein